MDKKERQGCPTCGSSDFHQETVNSLFFGQKRKRIVCSNGHPQNPSAILMVAGAEKRKERRWEWAIPLRRSYVFWTDDGKVWQLYGPPRVTEQSEWQYLAELRTSKWSILKRCLVVATKEELQLPKGIRDVFFQQLLKEKRVTTIREVDIANFDRKEEAYLPSRQEGGIEMVDLRGDLSGAGPLLVNQNIQGGVSADNAVAEIITGIIRRHENPYVSKKTKENHKAELITLKSKYPRLCSMPGLREGIEKILNAKEISP